METIHETANNLNGDAEETGVPVTETPLVTIDQESAERAVSYAGEIVVPTIVTRPNDPDPRWDPIAGGL